MEPDVFCSCGQLATIDLGIFDQKVCNRYVCDDCADLWFSERVKDVDIRSDLIYEDD